MYLLKDLFALNIQANYDNSMQFCNMYIFAVSIIYNVLEKCLKKRYNAINLGVLLCGFIESLLHKWGIARLYKLYLQKGLIWVRIQ